jgi:hypothetical protein
MLRLIAAAAVPLFLAACSDGRVAPTPAPVLGNSPAAGTPSDGTLEPGAGMAPLSAGPGSGTVGGTSSGLMTQPQPY